MLSPAVLAPRKVEIRTTRAELAPSTLPAAFVNCVVPMLAIISFTLLYCASAGAAIRLDRARTAANLSFIGASGREAPFDHRPVAKSRPTLPLGQFFGYGSAQQKRPERQWPPKN